MARKVRLYWLRHRNVHQSQYRGSVFRIVRYHLVAAALGASAAADAARSIALERGASTALLKSSKENRIYFALLFLCFAAMFMTGSRGAVVLSLLALVIAFVAFFRRDMPGRSGLAVALAGGGAQERLSCCNSWGPESMRGSIYRAQPTKAELRPINRRCA